MELNIVPKDEKPMMNSESGLPEILKGVLLSVSTKISFRYRDGITIGLEISHNGSPEKLETLSCIPSYLLEILQTISQDSTESARRGRVNFLKVRKAVVTFARELGMPIKLLVTATPEGTSLNKPILSISTDGKTTVFKHL